MSHLKLIPLASSSHGNAYLVEDGTTCLLIECGVSWKKLQKLTGFGVSGIAGCLISHEHKDHAGCYEQLIRSGVPVYASRGTAEALGCEQLEPLEDREVVTLGSFDILPFPTFHDAAEPMGFLIRSRTDGDKLVFATDTVNLSKYFCAGISGWNSLGKNGLAGSVTFDTNGTVSWYATASVGDYNFRDSPNIQFNAQSVTYSYIAIG